MLAFNLLLGNPLKPDILGMVAGHLYYFLTVLHPLAGGEFMLKTPLWVYPFLSEDIVTLSIKFHSRTILNEMAVFHLFKFIISSLKLNINISKFGD